MIIESTKSRSHRNEYRSNVNPIDGEISSSPSSQGNKSNTPATIPISQSDPVDETKTPKENLRSIICKLRRRYAEYIKSLSLLVTALMYASAFVTSGQCGDKLSVLIQSFHFVSTIFTSLMLINVISFTKINNKFQIVVILSAIIVIWAILIWVYKRIWSEQRWKCLSLIFFVVLHF